MRIGREQKIGIESVGMRPESRAELAMPEDAYNSPIRSSFADLICLC